MVLAVGDSAAAPMIPKKADARCEYSDIFSIRALINS